MNNQDGNGQYIWLRYATQYSKDGRTHTVEMGVPIPLGASVEKREELFREAEIGMSQLAHHIEQRVSQALGHVQSTQNTDNRRTTAPVSPTKASSTASSSSISSASSIAASAPTRPTPDQSTPVQARPANKPASVPAPQTASQAPNNVHAATPAGQGQDIPQNRPHVGASMPTSLSPNSVGGNLQIPDFVSYINENMNLKPRQAMDLLGVKSLSGINLREALEHLKRIVAQNAQNEQNGTNVAQQSSQRQEQQVATVREVRPVVSSASSVPPSQPMASTRQDSSIPIDELSTRPTSKALENPEQERESNVVEMRVPRQVQPAQTFDEEIGEEDELEDLEELDNFNPPSEFSSEQLDEARLKINSLREMQGAAVANPARLQALRNAADAEVSDGELLELAIGIWNIQSMKKLKVDQVEALISWAKQDYFLEEAEAVLTVLEEERYARGNR